MNTTLFAILSFIFGTLIGSFLSVLIHRTKKGLKGIVVGRSVCPNCKKVLKTSHLIPLFSYIILNGKCGFCKKKIPFRYFLLELFTGGTLLIMYLLFPFIAISERAFEINFFFPAFIDFIYYSTVFSILILIAFYDYLYQEIPDRFSLPLIVITLIYAFFSKSIGLDEALLGGLIPLLFFGLQYLVSKGKWIGGGDLRLGPAVGLLLGWPLILVNLILAYLLGSFAAIYLLITKKYKKNLKIAFGPFIIIGTFITLLYGEKIIEYYLKLLGY